MTAHDHTKCCGPDSAWAAGQWLCRQSGQHAYRWRREMGIGGRAGGAGWVELTNRYDARGWRDAVFCERPAVNAIALQWDQNRQGLYR